MRQILKYDQNIKIGGCDIPLKIYQDQILTVSGLTGPGIAQAVHSNRVPRTTNDQIFVDTLLNEQRKSYLFRFQVTKPKTPVTKIIFHVLNKNIVLF